MPWDLCQAKIQLCDEWLYESERTGHQNHVHVFYLVVRQNPKSIAELFRSCLILCYIDLRQISSP